mmetsp:Transcript_2528/g.7483  ORF Transcript_2528/g.7483 Transcript_2528/m.7483 type:complete len:201 (-) Transcript_2528:494-1096(-)
MAAPMAAASRAFCATAPPAACSPLRRKRTSPLRACPYTSTSRAATAACAAASEANLTKAKPREIPLRGFRSTSARSSAPNCERVAVRWLSRTHSSNRRTTTHAEGSSHASSYASGSAGAAPPHLKHSRRRSKLRAPHDGQFQSAKVSAPRRGGRTVGAGCGARSGWLPGGALSLIRSLDRGSSRSSRAPSRRGCPSPSRE